MSDPLKTLTEKLPDPSFDPWADMNTLGGISTQGFEPAPPVAEATATEEPQGAAIVKVYDFGDGPIQFEATDVDDLANQITIYQNRRFEEKILQEDAFRPEAPLEPDFDYQPVPEPTVDQISAAWLEFQQNPVKGLRTLNKYIYGDQFEDELKAAREVRNYLYGNWVGEDFVNRHVRLDEDGYIIGGDYFPTAENAAKIRKYMEVKGLEPNPQNYDYALAKLNEIHALSAMPEPEYEDEDAAPAAKEMKASSALSGRDSYYPSNPSQDKLTVAEIKKRAMEASEEDLVAAIRGGYLVGSR